AISSHIARVIIYPFQHFYWILIQGIFITINKESAIFWCPGSQHNMIMLVTYRLHSKYSSREWIFYFVYKSSRKTIVNSKFRRVGSCFYNELFSTNFYVYFVIIG